MPRYPGLTLRILARRLPAIGPGKADLLKKIADSGSISAAAREMGMSYRRAWQLVDAMNAAFSGPLVTTAIGGKRGGGAVVTDLGQEALAQFRKMEAKASNAISGDIERFSKLLKPSATRSKKR